MYLIRIAFEFESFPNIFTIEEKERVIHESARGRRRRKKKREKHTDTYTHTHPYRERETKENIRKVLVM